MILKKKHLKLHAQKYITWELTSIAINTVVIWSFTGSFTLASGIIIASLLPRFIAYNIHERLYHQKHKRLFRKKKKT